MTSTLKSILFITSISVLVSCENASNNETPTEQTEMSSTETKDNTNKFEGIQFASAIDTICGMPITAGVEDTLMVDSKVYGFCATECKHEFAKQIGRP